MPILYQVTILQEFLEIVIAIDNARLYNSLEQKVQDCTRQLPKP